MQCHDNECIENGTASGSVSKGKWERRLQTDIHTAKQALCEALSLDKSNTTTTTMPRRWDRATEEIRTPRSGSARARARGRRPSLARIRISVEDGNLKADCGETQMPFGLLDKWLFDGAAAQGQDGDFVEIALRETADLF
ncbi:hypothetical protein SASPL_151479 [Salvia splendens]|uniref:Uncharacterized protein n=1 Tax=Salvia splendens TaxID=180675 RepID=A0A8X8Z3R2_SALSN|nr:hypothetical protein SASPL_151479 [Salvia splendens]